MVSLDHPTSTRLDKLGGLALLIGGISSFQIGAALAKGLFPLFGAEGMVGLRVGLAAVILLIVVRPGPSVLRPGLWRLLLPYGASMAVMNFAFYVALVRLPLGLVVAFEFMGPLSLALIGSRRCLTCSGQAWWFQDFISFCALIMSQGTLTRSGLSPP